MIHKPRLIGLCGDIGCGKSTVAEYLRRKHGYQRKAFANLLKHVALDVFHPMGMRAAHVFGTQEEKNLPLPGIMDSKGEPQTGRRILEWLGTEGFRTIDPDVWVKALLNDLKFGGERYVIEDLRFPNEIHAIRNRRGIVWRVVKIGGDKFPTGHESDNAWRTVVPDYTLEAAAGDLHSLCETVDDLLRRAI